MHSLGPFDIIEPIGEGGMGTVWRGVHRAQQLPVAIKFVLSKSVGSTNLMERFADEVRAVAGLDHPGIVSVFDYGRVPISLEESTNGLLVADSPWLAMELITGGTLRSAPPKNWAELHDCLKAILEALASAHARGILHRDLKPDNVLFASQSDVRAGLRLVDFGLAFLDEGQGEADEQKAAGTPRYMAPEQLLSHWRDFGPWTDLYALGCLGWQLSTGSTPFQSMRDFRQLLRAHLHLAPPAYKPIFKVPNGFETWLRTLLAKRRTDRFPMAADALNALPPIEMTETLQYTADLGQNESTEVLDMTVPDLPSAASLSLKTANTLIDDATAPSLEVKGVVAPPTEVKTTGLTNLDETIPEMPDQWVRDGDEDARLQMLGVGLGLFGLRHTHLIGREKERSLLWQALKDTRKSGTPKIVVLSGGPGSGKSRLADWLANRSHETGAAIPLRCNHEPQGNSKSGLPGMLNRYLHTAGLTREELEDRVSKQLQRQGIEDAFELRSLCDFLHGENESSLTDFSVSIKFQSPDERMALLLRFLRRTSAKRPVVLWMDDVQWGDEALLLAKRLQAVTDEEHLPVLIVMTLRDDLIEDRPFEHQLYAELDHDRVITLPITPLPDIDQVALVEDMLGLEPKLARKVVSRSQGNPLFAIQLVGDWVHRGVLEIGKRGFALKAGTKAVIPSSIAQVWNERIDALLREMPADSEQMLELGATLGVDVDREEWAAVCTAEGIELDSHLIEGLLRRRLAEASGTGRLRHAHGMLGETLLARAKEAKRLKRHHEVCAHMLESKSGQLGIAERRSRHLIAAGLHEAALEPLLKAATERRASSDLRQAIRLLDIHEKAANRIPMPDHDERRLRAQILRSDILNLLKKGLEASQIASKTLDASRQLNTPYLIGASLRVLGISKLRSGATQSALDMFEEALVNLQMAEAEELIVQTRCNLVDISRQVGWWERAKLHLEKGLEEAELLKSSLLIGNTHFYAGILYLQLDDLQTASNHYLQAKHAYEQADNTIGLAHCINALGDLARRQGNFEAAETSFRKAIKLYQQIGSGFDVQPLMSLALAHIDMDNMGSAQTLLENGCSRFRKDDHRLLLGCALACLLPCYARSKDWDSWDQAIEESTTLLEETGVLSDDIARPVQIGAEIAAKANKYERARSAYQLALKQWMGLERTEKVNQVVKSLDRLMES